jgi:ABC-type lipoprotein export system ATPase subunit
MSDPQDDCVLEINGLEHHLRDPARGEEFVVRVRRPLTIRRGNFVALLGPSGCGKTTLLTLLGLLRSPSHPERLERFRMRTGPPGQAVVHDLRATWMARRGRAVEELRRRHVGFSLQSGELLPALTVRENIEVPLRLNGFGRERCLQRVDELLQLFQLRAAEGSRLEHSRVNRLSGGEYQRVCLARAVAHRPSLLFVDEPTASLNRELAWAALDQLRVLQASGHSQGATVMITHDEELARGFADVIVRMAPVRGEAAGEVVSVTANAPGQDVELSFDGPAAAEDIP